MKHKGSHFEYERDRNRDLMRVYNQAVQLGRKKTKGWSIYDYIVRQPSVRFWISEERAYIYIRNYFDKGHLPPMRACRRQMLEDILDRVSDLSELYPHESLYGLVFRVVNEPAPCFYLTPKSAKVIISKIRQGWYQRRLEKLRKPKVNRYNTPLKG